MDSTIAITTNKWGALGALGHCLVRPRGNDRKEGMIRDDLDDQCRLGRNARQGQRQEEERGIPEYDFVSSARPANRGRFSKLVEWQLGTRDRKTV